MYSGGGELKELLDGRVAPPILANRLRRLERISGRAMLNQWAHEFRSLCERYKASSDGHWQYFVVGERETAAGSFVTRRGQLARSAYLRTLSLAHDVWGMPHELALEESLYATPSNLSLAQVVPGERPEWALRLQDRRPGSATEWAAVAKECCDLAVEGEANPELLHLDIKLATNELYEADLKIISVLHEGEISKPAEVFEFYDSLLGTTSLTLDESSQSHIAATEMRRFITETQSEIFPAVFPALDRHFGYFHLDLLHRLPFMPANYSKHHRIDASGTDGGMDFSSSNRKIGELRIWLDRWSPTHNKHSGSHYGTSLRVASAFRKDFLGDPRMKLSLFWCATVCSREKTYADWTEEVVIGQLA